MTNRRIGLGLGVVLVLAVVAVALWRGVVTQQRSVSPGIRDSPVVRREAPPRASERYVAPVERGASGAAGAEAVEGEHSEVASVSGSEPEGLQLSCRVDEQVSSTAERLLLLLRSDTLDLEPATESEMIGHLGLLVASRSVTAGRCGWVRDLRSSFATIACDANAERPADEMLLESLEVVGVDCAEQDAAIGAVD